MGKKGAMENNRKEVGAVCWGRSERRGILGAEIYKMRRGHTREVPLLEGGESLKSRRLEKSWNVYKVKEKEGQMW